MNMDTIESKKYTDEALYVLLKGAVSIFQENKPGDRSERDRSFAVTITELEKVLAYFKVFVVDG